MAKIITITCHTALDYRIELEAFIPGTTMQAKQSCSYAGGKGINVAKAVAALGTPVLALGFVGKQSIDSFTSLNSELLSTDFTSIDGTTRTNLTLNDQVSETHIRTQGFAITNADCQQLIQRIQLYLEAGDIVVISGSLPPGAPPDLYALIIECCHQHDVCSILDSNGIGLQSGLKAHPSICKPNQHELAALFDDTLTTTSAIIDAGKAMVNAGCPMVIVSCGDKGLIAINEQTALVATIKNINTTVLSTVGCGDALVAGLALAKLQHKDFVEMTQLAIACATANLASPEPGKIAVEQVAAYLNGSHISSHFIRF